MRIIATVHPNSPHESPDRLESMEIRAENFLEEKFIAAIARVVSVGGKINLEANDGYETEFDLEVPQIQNPNP